MPSYGMHRIVCLAFYHRAGRLPPCVFLVYEYLTGGGLWSETGSGGALASLLDEAEAMAESVVYDLLGIPGVEVLRLVDARTTAKPTAARNISVGSAAEDADALAKWAGQSEWTLLIAPETGGRLFERCERVELHGGRLLSPDSQFVALTGDKGATAERLSSHSVPVPVAIELNVSARLPSVFPYPAVIKPRDGAGSVQTCRVASPTDIVQNAPSLPARLEKWHAGTPASISAICGPAGCLWLPPCRQLISDDGRYHYLGGSTPLSRRLAQRAGELGCAVLEALPPATGYIGIDMILGDAPDGSRDVVLEVNPRLTTSYVGLRHVATGNLAEAMIAVASGETTAVSFDNRAIQFDMCGRVAPRP